MRISLAAAFEVAVQPLVQVHGIEGLRGVYGPASMPSSRRPIPGIVNSVVVIDARRYDAVLFDLDAAVARSPLFDSAVALFRRLVASGMATGAFSCSAVTQAALRGAGLGELFQVQVDGRAAAERRRVLHGASRIRLPATTRRRRRGGPLLCAGIIGYRALQRVSQSPRGRAVGNLWVGRQRAPHRPGCDRAGCLPVHVMTHLSNVPALNYERELFYEREIRSVTANTREDGEAFLQFAANHRLQVTTHEYPLASAQQALADLKAGRFDGAAVLRTAN
jgi:hypothetical protein